MEKSKIRDPNPNVATWVESDAQLAVGVKEDKEMSCGVGGIKLEA